MLHLSAECASGELPKTTHTLVYKSVLACQYVLELQEMCQYVRTVLVHKCCYAGEVLIYCASMQVYHDESNILVNKICANIASSMLACKCASELVCKLAILSMQR